MVAVDRKVQLCLWSYSRQVGVIVRWLLYADKYSCVSGSMVDKLMLL